MDKIQNNGTETQVDVQNSQEHKPTETKSPETNDQSASKLRKVFEEKLATERELRKSLEEEMKVLRTNVEGRHVSNLYKEHDIQFDEQKELLKTYQSNTGKSLDEILSSDLIKKELSSIAGRKKAEMESEQGGAASQKSFETYAAEKAMPKDPKQKKEYMKWRRSQISASDEI